MNAKQLFATAALVFASTAAFAQEVTPFPEFEHFVSSKSRVQVKDEVMLSRLQGQAVARNTEIGAPDSKIVDGKSRDAVRQEAIQSAKKGGNEHQIGG